MSELEIRLESQEQYFRRTSLRFHNIKEPVNERGRIISPVNTDDFIRVGTKRFLVSADYISGVV
jgi:hypothetical protein